MSRYVEGIPLLVIVIGFAIVLYEEYVSGRRR